MSVKAWEISAENRETLIAGAFEAKNGSYSPYSKFPVGAALLSVDGTLIKGANIENASYDHSTYIMCAWVLEGGTICAERTAIVKAVSEGKRSFIGLAVVTDVPSPISPCGICRQVLREFCSLSMPILLVPGDYPQPPPKEGEETKPGVTEGGVKETTLDELLPDSFGPEHLDLPRGS
ncbi:putative this enzyme scavenges exogenous and endogenous cytidine and 2'-deoxycytidine for UMP synthesis [Lyophyllum shimeji]|uniref:Cytidine deaminase n=1 Tax=Lyophyllum shimeji TaxID=47721 RepID=A0A9P3PUI3_LYOSH|nr:putative this enzyme scavenges exogenous and endogenous cytidine and 2'-deoxycytidine for UMP synthesis [Lyophyllum shimeji]